MTAKEGGGARHGARMLQAAILGAVIMVAAACGGSPASGTHQEPSADAAAAAQLKYASCMRSHGVTNFPEPGSQGLPQTGGPVDIGSPQYLAAEQACARYGAAGATTNPGVSTQVMQAELKYVSCMRSHGVPDMPDPNGNGTLTLPTGGAVSASSPQFQSAQKACQQYYPALGGGS